MSSDLLKRRSKIRIGNMVDSDFEIHAIRALGMVEKPTNIISAILKRHMRHSSLTKRNSPRYDTVLHGRCHGCPGRNHHLDVGTRSEERCSHSITIHLILKQDPLAHTALAVVMAGAESRVISRFLEPIVEVSVHEKLDSFFDGYLVTADRPVGFGFLAGVEPVDVDKRSVTTAESFPQDGFVGE